MVNRIDSTIEFFKDKEVIGEITIVIRGIQKDENEEINKSYLKKDLNELTNAGLSLSAASMYLAKKLTTRSLPEIGRKFANRDHTTVIHAVKTIEKLSQDNSLMKKNIDEITSIILSD